MRASHFRALSLVALFAPLAARSQTLRGITVDGAGQPVSGVVVMLLDSASRVAARGMTTVSGEFRLTAAHPGTYRLRTLRIGFRPTVSEPRSLGVGAEISRRVVLSGIPVALDAVRTTAQSVCRAFADSAAATFAVWEQVHAALTAADLAANSRTIVATTLAYERTLENLPVRGAEHVIKQSAHVSSSYVARPWREVPPDSLHRGGYIVAERDNVTAYYAPGLDVLLSNGFVEDHCFRLTSDRASPGLVGIAFEPSPERKKIAEIRGTMWVDRASAELRRLEFKYANVSQEEQETAGGDIQFTRVRDGTWLISRWNIRMPVFEQALKAMDFRRTARITAIQVSGGEVALARRGSDTLWSRPPLAVSGTIRDSISRAPVNAARIALLGTTVETTADADGRFTFRGALPGEYTAAVQTRSLDSVNTVHHTPLLIVDSATAIEVRVPSAQQFVAALCGRGPSRGSTSGVILGSARSRSDSMSRAMTEGLTVIAEWGVDFSNGARVRRTEARAAADGSYRICDVPLDVPVSLRAVADSSETANPKLVRLSSAVRLTRADLVLDAERDLMKRGATFIGIVLSDSSRQPVAGVEVALPGVGKSAFTDSTGAFRIVGIVAGEHRVLARRIGYGAADTALVFTGHETVERRVVLGRAVTLEGVTVTARANEREIPGFEDNRRVGLGHFLTRVDLEKYTGMQLGPVLDQLSGISTIRGNGHLWVSSRYQPPVACQPTDTDCLKSAGYYLPSRSEVMSGMASACYAQVYIDGVLMNGIMEPTEPFDLNTVVPETVEAVEWYAGASQTPLKYARMASGCGVLVIWTRRGR